jgi:hypothetical protein
MLTFSVIDSTFDLNFDLSSDFASESVCVFDLSQCSGIVAKVTICISHIQKSLSKRQSVLTLKFFVVTSV